MEDLTNEQRAAVTSTAPHLAIIAGAGSGKTRTIIARTQHLLEQGVHPSRVLVTTFTTAAAHEVQTRLRRAGVEELPNVRTMHSLCAQLIRDRPSAAGRMPGFVIYDEHTATALYRLIAKEEGVDNADKARLDTLRANDKLRAIYATRLREGNAVDYDELEQLAMDLLAGESSVFDHVLVDEAQDLNPIQWLIIGRLRAPNVCLVGDPRQAIYQFRGADSSILDGFAGNLATEVVHLTRTFRFGGEVARLANGLQPGYPALEPMRDLGHVYPYKLDDEAAWVAKSVHGLVERGVPHRDIAVLSRTWASLWRIRRELRNLGVRGQTLGHGSDPWTSPHGSALAWWLMLHTNRFDNNLAALVATTTNSRVPLGLLRSESIRKREPLATTLVRHGHLPPMVDSTSALKVGAALPAIQGQEEVQERLLGRLTGWRDTVEGFAQWWAFGRTAADRLSMLRPDTVPLMTIHSAKGLEWPHVYLIGATDYAFSARRPTDSEDEHRNLLYVACTRAQKGLVVTRPASVPLRSGKIIPTRPLSLVKLNETGA